MATPTKTQAKTQAATKKLVEQMLASFAAVLDREFHHKLEARELLQATKTDDKIRKLAGLTENIHQRMEEIERRLLKAEKLKPVARRKRKKKL